jgi:formate/nitrite transporter
MAFKTPDQIAVAATNTGVTKANLTLSKMLAGSFLAGAYIAFAGLLGIATTSGLKADTWGTLPTLIFGLVFSTGLVLVILAGSELVTGNMALYPLALLSKRVSPGRVAVGFLVVTIGNLIGSLFIAYFIAVKTGIIGSASSAQGSSGALTFARIGGVATGKAVTETDWQIFLRAIGCNWLVCLAVWLALAGEDLGGKILGIFFPIMAFVAMGFDHVVANMFFLPAGMFAHVPGLTWAHTFNNLLFAFLGNIIGAAVFVAMSYWYLHLRGRPAGVGTADSDTGEHGLGAGGFYTGDRPATAGVTSNGGAATHRATGAPRPQP